MFSRLRNRYYSWLQNVPLPDLANASLVFQSWQQFDHPSQKWETVCDAGQAGGSRQRDAARHEASDKISIVSWNVDSSSALPAERLADILAHIRSDDPDVVFFQELSRQALAFLLGDAQVRERWYSSEADDASWKGQSFASLTLLSRARFGASEASIGPLWRVRYPSRFGRDALCCDVFLERAAGSGPVRTRLVNVHLDSLPIQPSQRPRQLAVVASLLRCAGRGLVAGDFNPVLPEDLTLVQDNGLVDAWLQLHPDEPGFTWGVDGKQPFPPNRMDKVATVGVRPQSMSIMHPGVTTPPTPAATRSDEDQVAKHGKEGQKGEPVPWSDHSGLRGSFSLDIEIVINDCDQEKVFEMLTSRCILPSVPQDAGDGGGGDAAPAARPTEFRAWKETRPTYRFMDRRRTRMATASLYELPRTGDPMEDYFLPFLIFYSTEEVGLAPVPALPKNCDDDAAAAVPESRTLFSGRPESQTFHVVGNGYSHGALPCLVPSFARLVESEMHVLLCHAEFHSPVWGQHMAQLSELPRSRSCPEGPSGLSQIVGPRFSEFAEHVKRDLAGQADHGDLAGLRSRYVSWYHGNDDHAASGRETFDEAAETGYLELS